MLITICPNLFAQKGIDDNRTDSMIIVAHRGGAGLGLENTLSCIEKGIASGADAIEIDIHLTKDGHLLVCHDKTVNRTTDGKGRIRDMTLAELQALHIKDAKGNITDEHLPVLKEVFELVNGRAVLLIEIKRTGSIYQGIEQKLVDEIKRYNASSWVIVQSFNDSVLENIHAIDISLRLEKLIFFKLFGLPYIFDVRFTKFTYEKYSYVQSFNIYHGSATRRWVNEIHKQGKQVKIWTLQTPKKTPKVPVDGVITDRPDLFIVKP